MAVSYAKFGLDANQPIDGSGNIARRLQNPDYIANSGAHWTRLNFVLPNTSFLDRYDRIVDSLLSRGVKIYATIGHDAIRDLWIGDKLRDANNPTAAAWIEAYARRFREIVERYQSKIFVYEAINEPNGWQGGQTALVHPRWFVHMMNTLYGTIRPRARGIRLISGPLEATWLNTNEAARYLSKVYQTGNWAPGQVPWDGLGYHLYIGEDPASEKGTDGSTDPEDVRRTYAKYMAQLWGVMQHYDPYTKHLIFVSEFGWTSDLGEDFQARQLALMMELLAKDERVGLGIAFCTEDFYRKFGLYVEGMSRPKKAFGQFRNLMLQHAPTRSTSVDFGALEGPVDVPVDDPGDGASAPWSIGQGFMKHPVSRRGVILLPPYDDSQWAQAVLAAGHYGQAGVTVCWSPGEAALNIAGEKRMVLVVNPTEWGTPDGSMVPWFARNAPGLLVREESFNSPQALTAWLRAHPDPFAGL